jgi:hypothetical protein
MIYQHSTTEDDRRIADAMNDKIKAVSRTSRCWPAWCPGQSGTASSMVRTDGVDHGEGARGRPDTDAPSWPQASGLLSPGRMSRPARARAIILASLVLARGGHSDLRP